MTRMSWKLPRRSAIRCWASGLLAAYVNVSHELSCEVFRMEPMVLVIGLVPSNLRPSLVTSMTKGPLHTYSRGAAGVKTTSADFAQSAGIVGDPVFERPPEQVDP